MHLAALPAILLALTLLLPANAAAQASRREAAPPNAAIPPAKKPMGFRIVTNDPDAPAGKQQRWVAATGQITPDTPQVFDWFLKGNDIAGLTIYFDSAGGSIVGGIRLGDALRKAKARVAIGRSTPVGPEPKKDEDRLPRHQLLPARGICFSSCAYAFLGGSTRQIAPMAAYGLHMFWPGDQMENILSRKYAYGEIERAQRISANLAAYFQRVGADATLLQIASSTPPLGAIRRLSPREIVQYRVAEIYLAPPALAGPGQWGLALDQKQARISGDGVSRTKGDREVAYTLELSCPAAKGFVKARFEMAPKDTGQTVSLTRAVLIAGKETAVLAESDKDIVARPARFPRRSSNHPQSWIGASGEIMDDVLEEAALRNPSHFAVLVEDGTSSFEAPFATGNLRQAYGEWRSACARIARSGSSLP